MTDAVAARRDVVASREAARALMDELRFEEAVGLLLPLRERVDAGSADQVELLVDLGDALLGLGETSRAGDVFTDAARVARRLDRADLLASAALGFGAGLGGFEIRMADDRQAALLEEADRLLGDEVSVMAAYVRSRLSVAATFMESPGRRLELARSAVGVAEQLDDAGALAHALAALCDAVAGAEHVDERLRHSDRIIDLARTARRPELVLLGRRLQVVALLERGDFAEADRSIAAFRRDLALHPLPVASWYVPLWHGMRAVMRGDLHLVDELAAEAARLGNVAGSVNSPILVGTLRFNVGLATGDLDPEVAAMARAACQDEVARSGRLSARVVLLDLARRDGKLDEARRHLDLLVAGGFGESDSERLGTLFATAEAALDLGAHDVATTIRSLLEPHERLWAIDGIGAGVIGSVREILGAIDLAVDGDSRRLEDATEEYEALGAPLMARRGRQRLGPSSVEPRGATVAVASAALVGEFWEFAHEGERCMIKDGKGVRDLVTLLDAPGTEVPALQLASPGRDLVRPSGGLPVLDERARAEYRERIGELEVELAEAEADNDLARIEHARVEYDFLLDELRAATGLAGRTRETGGDAERARQAVRARIRHAIGRIADHAPGLGAHLSRSVHTGHGCVYTPEDPVRWEISR